MSPLFHRHWPRPSQTLALNFGKLTPRGVAGAKESPVQRVVAAPLQAELGQ
jgi:hypothetical protein